MPIFAQNGWFCLETAKTSYQMKVDHYGILNHLWYGIKTGCRMDYLLAYPDVGFSGNIYDAENQRTYSTDTLPLEYSAAGAGDYRIPAISVTHGNGSTALDLRFQDFRIEKGKYRIPGLPAVYAEPEQAETLEIFLKDKGTKVRVILKYGVLPDEDVITRSVVVVNDGDEPFVINRVHSICLDIPYGYWEWIHFYGRHAMERQPERRPLIHGIQESSSTRGTSSHQQNPAIILCEKDCRETDGFCIGAAFMYSGGFQAQIEQDQLDQVRMVIGINPETFAWTLTAGESFYAPEVILSCTDKGLGKLSHCFHSVIRHHVCRGSYKLAPRPIPINNWEATYFNFDENKIIEIAGQAAALGIEMAVLDDGWFGIREDDISGLGDWFVNKAKIPGGLGHLAEQINRLGMKFGLWFEPEMISEDSELYRRHPEWVLRIPGRDPVRSRYQLVLDMTNPAVTEYLYHVISQTIKESRITYIKWDMNRSICDWYSLVLAENRQKEIPHRYILGLYALLERLTHDFPEVLFEGCSGGGGRFDAGMLYYCPQIWLSDDTDAYERTLIQYGTSFFYPTSTVGSHVSAVPNHQTGRVTSLRTRGIVAMAGNFGYELDLGKLDDAEKQEIKKQIVFFKQHQDLIHNGLYYRLSSPLTENFAVWAWTAPDRKRMLVQGVIFRARPNHLKTRIRLVGLDKKQNYRLENSEEIYSGAALISGGLLLPQISGDNVAFAIYLVPAPTPGVTV